MPESTSDVKIESVPDLEAPRIEDDEDDDSDDTIPDLEDAGNYLLLKLILPTLN